MSVVEVLGDSAPSCAAQDDSSPPEVGDAASRDVAATCGWCAGLLKKAWHKFCGRRCRQAAWRLRGRRAVSASPGATGPLRFAYADPPYPGLSRKYYGDQESFAGEVDHPELIASLRARHDAGEIAGWALSTAGRSLRDLLPLCPEGVHVAVWVKDLEVPPATYGMHYRWEAVIVAGGRQLQPGVRDWLMARPARLGGSDLPGRKPIAFWAWLFDLLGMVPGDAFDDLFPGTGQGARAWAHLSRVAGGDEVSRVDGRRVVLSRLQERRPVAIAGGSDESSPPGEDDAQPSNNHTRSGTILDQGGWMAGLNGPVSDQARQAETAAVVAGVNESEAARPAGIGQVAAGRGAS